MRASGHPRSTVLAFNSVERLLRGDFFHSVSPTQVTDELALFPSDWPVAGVGTTNWYRRNGELVIDGVAARPRFLWADPDAEPFGEVCELEARDSRIGPSLVSPQPGEADGCPHLPFAAVGVWDPGAPRYEWTLDGSQDVHSAITQRCAGANVGLAALRLDGRLSEVVYQTMCHIPLGGVRPDQPASARKEAELGAEWTAVGFYSANPTIQTVLGFPSTSVHLHGFMPAQRRGGHWNYARAGSGVDVEVHPMQDLVLQIPGLDVAMVPPRQLTA